MSAVVLSLFIFTACEKEKGSTGTLNLSITDALVFGMGQHSNRGCYLECEDGSTTNLFVPG